ncbi:hypothetical protein CWS96_gp09 [Saline Natrinema sp. J7-1 virus 1]|uniref:Uncharacterized protein n=1 Tax=Saline Natrinema sp. J7-1 virus 1 TaxID=2847285 RepID=A0AAE9VPT2_9VIRU|nr:hypothetical protein CWS96_gp09 [Saline Natrinema sp. J7-1 virus 1]WBE14042.1 hypothetical protein [Saline Natrinema sp. J7-1 virus 1]
MSDRDRSESMWFCPHCTKWVGCKLDRCLEGHDRPRLPLRSDDVDFDASWRVDLRDRLRGKLRSLLGWVR